MKIYYDNYERPEQAKLYLGTPSNKVLCALNGVVEDSASLTKRLNNNYELTFDVDRYILDEDGVQIESNGYDWLEVKMRVYLDTMGWFICDSPTVHNDGIREYKTITAYSCDIEMLQHDLINLKINCGTTDSYEMLVEGNVDIIDDVEFAKEFITFYNRERPELSFLDIVLKHSGIRGWTIGHVDDIPYEYTYFENGELKKKYVSLSLEKGTFNIEAQDLYSFLTQDAAQHFNCVFLFDFKHMVINVWRPNNLGKNTNVNIGFRNLQNSNDISVSENDLFTRYMVYGNEGLSIEFVNFGWRRIENLTHFLNEKYLSRELIAKYKLWLEDVEYYRPQFIEYSRLYNAQLEVVSDLTNRVPLDDCSTNWKTFEDDELLEAKKNYEAQLKGYESYYVDENNNFDKEALDNSVDASTYYQIKDVILPSIEIEMNNRLLIDEDDFEEYIKTYETDWDLYGLDELKAKLETYKNTVEVCKSKHYDIPYETYKSMSEQDSEKYPSHTESYHTKMYDKYQEAEHQLNAKYSDSCQYACNVRQKEVDEANKILEGYDDERDKIIKYVEKETWNHRTSTSTASVDADGTLSVSEQNLDVINGVLTADFSPYVDGDGVLSFDHEFYFTEQDLSDLSKLYIDGEYTNEYMFLVGADTAVTAIDEQLKLLDAATEDLYIASQPQYLYTSDAENFLAQVEYKNYVENLELGDFIWLGVRDDEVVKLRLIAMTYNPMVMDGQLEIEFSNMIKSRASRDDFSFLLGSATSRGKSSASGSGNNYVSNGEVALTSGLITKLLQNGAFKNGLDDIVGDAIGGAIEGNDAIFEYLQAELISADTVVANSGSFNTLEALVGEIKTLLSGSVGGQNAQFINLTAENTRIAEAVIMKLFAGEFAAGTIDTNAINLSSGDGGLKIVGNTMQFSDVTDDGKEVVRIQIGKDEKGNYNFVLYDEQGQGILIDSTGVHESAIADGLIKEDMYADGSITVNKMQGDMAQWEKDGQKVFNIATMYFNDKESGTVYNSMSEFVTQTVEDVETLKTSLGMIELIGEQFFKETVDGEITPASIRIDVNTKNNALVGKWFIDGVELTDFNTDDYIVADNFKSITINSSLIKNKDKSTIKVVDATGDLYDEITLYHIREIEGVQGEAAYTVVLGNENVTFVTDYDSNTCINDTDYTSSITVFKGLEERTDFTISEVISSNGITAYPFNLNAVYIEVDKGTEITAPNGKIEVHISIDGITFKKNIIWNRVSAGKAGEDGQPLTILGSFNSEEDLRKYHPTGKVGEAYMVNGYLYVWSKEKNDWDNVGRIQGDPSLNVVLANESQNIPCTNTGLVLDEVTLTVNYGTYKGLERIAGVVATPVNLPTGIRFAEKKDATVQEDGYVIFKVEKNSNLDSLMAGDINLVFTIDGKEITKTFTWSKALAGENGQVTLYELTASDMVLSKELVASIITETDETGETIERVEYKEEISPKKITFYAWAKDSTLDAIQEYVGDFVIEERTVDNTGFSPVGTPILGVTSYEHTVSENALGVRCTLYKAGTVKQLDRVTVAILSNSDSVSGAITTLTRTIGEVSSTVSQQDKKIEDKVSLTTYVKTIDKDGNEKTQYIKDYMADQVLDLTGFTSRVGTLETKTEDMATLEQVQTIIDQTEEHITLEASKTFISSDRFRDKIGEKNSIHQDEGTVNLPYMKGDLWLRMVVTVIPDYDEKTGEKLNTSTEKKEEVIYECVNTKGYTITGKTHTTEVGEALKPPYAVGDIWEKAVESNGKIEIEYWKCYTSKAEGASFAASDWRKEFFEEGDWQPATGYKTDGEISAAIKVEAGKITQRVYNTEEQSATLLLDVGRIKGEVYDLSDPDNPVSIIDQQAKKISLAVGKDGVVDENGNIISSNIVSSINISPEGVMIDAEKIRFSAKRNDGLAGAYLDTTILGINSTVFDENGRSIVAQNANNISVLIKDVKGAEKVATNFLDFSGDGMVVGKLIDDDGNQLTEDVLGNNVLIDSDSVDIRNGTTVLASYAADSIDLASNNNKARINFCGGSGYIHNTADTNEDNSGNCLTINSNENIALLTKDVAYLKAEYVGGEDETSAYATINARSTLPLGNGEGHTGFIRLQTKTDNGSQNWVDRIDMGSGNVIIASNNNSEILLDGDEQTITLNAGIITLKAGGRTVSPNIVLTEGGDGQDNIVLQATNINFDMVDVDGKVSIYRHDTTYNLNFPLLEVASDITATDSDGNKRNILEEIDNLDTNKADSNHNHSGVYADYNHTHSNYSTTSHTHNTLKQATTAYGSISLLLLANNDYALVPNDSYSYTIGSSGSPWQCIYGNTLELYKLPTVSSSSPTSEGYPALRINATNGKVHRHVASGSSKRFKTDIIEEFTDETLNPHNLYGVQLYQYKYRENHLSKDDQRYGQDLYGFIIEDLIQYYPTAVDVSKDGTLYDWNEKFIIPPMLKLIQEQHEQLEAQKSEIDSLKEDISELKQLITNLLK